MADITEVVHRISYEVYDEPIHNAIKAVQAQISELDKLSKAVQSLNARLNKLSSDEHKQLNELSAKIDTVSKKIAATTYKTEGVLKQAFNSMLKGVELPDRFQNGIAEYFSTIRKEAKLLSEDTNGVLAQIAKIEKQLNDSYSAGRERKAELKAGDTSRPRIKSGSDVQQNLTAQQQNNIQEGIKGYEQLANAATDAYDKILEAQISALDKEISLREKRVDAAKELAERGNTEILRIEEERLQKTMEQRERFARRQQAVNSAITVSNAIAAVARAALEGGGFGSIATIAALLAAMAAGYAAVTSLSQDAGAFADGIVDYKGIGGPRDDKNWVRISNGESVITAEGTKKNRQLLEAINKGAVLQLGDQSLPLLTPQFNQHNIPADRNYATSKDLSKLEQKLDNVVGAIEDSRLKQNIFFNEQGVGLMTERAINKDRKRWK